MKALVVFLVMISHSLWAGNDFGMDKKGVYVGILKDSRMRCSVEVLKVEKSLLTRKIQMLKVKIELENYKISETLKCSSDLDGTFCHVTNSSVHIGLTPKAGYHKNTYPDFYLKDGAKYFYCNDLALI
jgi:hypothetical protein